MELNEKYTIIDSTEYIHNYYSKEKDCAKFIFINVQLCNFTLLGNKFRLKVDFAIFVKIALMLFNS